MTRAELVEQVAAAIGATFWPHTKVGACGCGEPKQHCEPNETSFCECGACPGCPVFTAEKRAAAMVAINVVLEAAAGMVEDEGARPAGGKPYVLWGTRQAAERLRRAITAEPGDDEL